VESSHRLKLNHSVDHFEALQKVAERWSDTDPCIIREDCEIETRKHRVFIDLLHQPDDSLIPLCMADCIHNMRQALDHLAYRLAISLHRSDPPPNEDNTGFPITTTQTHFHSAVYAKIAPKKLMPKALYSALQAVQPHPGRHQHLWTLHELDNLDKHRFPPIVAGVVRGDRFHIGYFKGSYFVGPRLGPLEPETPVVEYIPDPNTDVHMDLSFAGEIALGKGSAVAPGALVLPLLRDIHTFIRQEVFGALEPFL